MQIVKLNSLPSQQLILNQSKSYFLFFDFEFFNRLTKQSSLGRCWTEEVSGDGARAISQNYVDEDPVKQQFILTLKIQNLIIMYIFLAILQRVNINAELILDREKGWVEHEKSIGMANSSKQFSICSKLFSV